MKALLFSTLILFIGFSSYAQKLDKDLVESMFQQQVTVITDSCQIKADILTDSDKKIKTNINYYYYSYYAHQIIKTQGALTGKVLHGQYQEIFKSEKTLKTKGEVKYGLRTGQWLEWYPNGNLKRVTHYKNGILTGKFLKYKEDGTLERSGTYKKGVVKEKSVRIEENSSSSNS